MDNPESVTTAQSTTRTTTRPATRQAPTPQPDTATQLAALVGNVIGKQPQKSPEPEPEPDEPEPFGPIVGEFRPGVLDFRRRLKQVSPHVSRVLITSDGEYLVVPPGKPITSGMRRRQIECLCEIDMGRHVTHIEHELPSMGDAFAFRASIDVQWRVADPVRVVMDDLIDAEAVLTPLLLGPLRRITRTFRVENCEQAEFAANRELARLVIGPEIGLETRTYVWLSMDDAVRERIQLADRVECYRNIIAAGDLSQFALRLAQDPDDVAEVVRVLIEERDAHRKDMVDLITSLIRSGAIDRWEIDDQVRSVLQWLQQTTTKVITGNDEARQFSTNGPAEPSNNGSTQTTRV
jgi:hypothetical protein